MAVRFYKGDLIEDAKVDIVCHQTNCQGVMGAGIAKQIRDTWPRVFGQYKLYCTKARAEGKPLLGTCQLVYTDEEKSRIVANLFGQEFYGRGKKQTDYDALRKALHAERFYPPPEAVLNRQPETVGGRRSGTSGHGGQGGGRREHRSGCCCAR